MASLPMEAPPVRGWNGTAVRMHRILAKTSFGTSARILLTDSRLFPEWTENVFLLVLLPHLALQRPRRFSCEANASFCTQVFFSAHFSHESSAPPVVVECSNEVSLRF